MGSTSPVPSPQSHRLHAIPEAERPVLLPPGHPNRSPTREPVDRSRPHVHSDRHRRTPGTSRGARPTSGCHSRSLTTIEASPCPGPPWRRGSGGEAPNGSARAHHLAEHVDVVVGRTKPDPRFLQPHPHLVLRALGALGGDPATSSFGDSTSDIQSAKAAGTRSVGYAN
ncbi:MAG TPA: HAD hydrolase-like protein [Propionibacteriaceae bacterium]|nr:HAD hydrolase-like protein [Propionibacteriaceae bacterium]